MCIYPTKEAKVAKHKTFNSLSKELKKISVRVGKNAAKVTRQSAFAALSVGVQRTPVDEGIARSGWNVGINTPDLKIPEKATSAAETIQAGAAVISGYKKDEGSIFLSNNVNYIKYLDDGSSKQAPAGMSKFAIDAARNVAKQAKLLGG